MKRQEVIDNLTNIINVKFVGMDRYPSPQTSHFNKHLFVPLSCKNYWRDFDKTLQ